MHSTTHRNRVREMLPGSLGEVDSLLEHFFGPVSTRPTSNWRALASAWEGEDGFHVEIDLPGVADESLELTFDQGLLTVTAERTLPEGDRKLWQNERSFGKVTRSLTLPDTADPGTIDARLHLGVLHVTIG